MNLRTFEEFVHRLLAEVVASWESDAVAPAESVVLSVALASASLAFVPLCCRGRLRVLLVASYFVLISRLWRFTQTRCGSIRMDITRESRYPHTWPWSSEHAPPREEPLYNLDQVPRLSMNSSSWLLWHEIQASSLPVVFDGAVADEVATGEWTPRRLAERLRGHVGQRQQQPQSEDDDTSSSNLVLLQMGHAEQQTPIIMSCDLPNFLERVDDDEWLLLFNGRTPYLAEQPVDAIGEDKAIQRVVDRLKPKHGEAPVTGSVMWWLGPRGARSGLHSDPEPVNVLHLLHGSKTVWLYPPSDAWRLYPSSRFDFGATCSSVDPFAPDPVKFPLFREAAPLAASLRAGDVLVVPGGWFHYAETHEASVSFSGRVVSTCQLLSFWDIILWNTLRHLGAFQWLGGDATDEGEVIGKGRDACAGE